MLKVWNVFLICLTFFLTIFGTFLTRAGLISSVHAFAQSDIGKYFVWFMAIIAASSLALIVWRLPLLRRKAEIEAVASREAMFVINNWALLGGATFILVATLFPKLSELWGDTVTVGPPFFNRWMAPIGLTIFALMGLAPLFGWRKTSPDALKRAFVAPTTVLAVTYLLHVAFGSAIGYPAFVERDAFYPGIVGVVLQKIGSALPGVTVAIAAFNVTVVVQEFARGVAARRRSAEKRNEQESVLVALGRLLDKNRRRYGGYIVHLGICAMFVGFTGGAWALDRETSMTPGSKYQLGRYELTYQGPRMCPGNPRCSPEEQADVNKRMIFADLDVSEGGKYVARLSPAKFIYHRQPESPTTEVAMIRGLRDDVYTVVGTVDPMSKRATFQFHLNPLVSWFWIGVLILISGATLSLWPELAFREVGAWAYVRAGAGVATSVMLGLWLTTSPTSAYAASERPTVVPASEPHREQPFGAFAAIGTGLALGGVLSVARRRRRR
jgi:cytochrome c-type biogenesis protein CcmF